MAKLAFGVDIAIGLSLVVIGFLSLQEAKGRDFKADINGAEPAVPLLCDAPGADSARLLRGCERGQGVGEAVCAHENEHGHQRGLPRARFGRHPDAHAGPRSDLGLCRGLFPAVLR
eukprot:527374-Rhodomonas_salina.2